MARYKLKTMVVILLISNIFQGCNGPKSEKKASISYQIEKNASVDLHRNTENATSGFDCEENQHAVFLNRTIKLIKTCRLFHDIYCRNIHVRPSFFLMKMFYHILTRNHISFLSTSFCYLSHPFRLFLPCTFFCPFHTSWFLHFSALTISIAQDC